MGLSRDWGKLVCFLDQCPLYDCFFFCARRLNFVTENYSSYHPYRKLLMISPGLYNFVRGFRGAYKPGKVTYSCACSKKVLQTQAALQC